MYSPRGGIMLPDIDNTDRKILTLLQENAGLSVADIAEKVNLSASPCWRRIKRLEEMGVIKQRITLLDREKLGLGFEAYVLVKLSLPNRKNLNQFEEVINKMPQVIHCSVVTGAVDFMLRVVAKDMQSYDDFLREELLAIDLVSDVQSRIVMRQVKDSHILPLIEMG